MSLSIDIKGLYKQFDDNLVVDNVSLSLEKGDVLGFLGPNGAGKSTTMRMITGYLEPSDGSVAICGYDMKTDPILAKSHIGYLPEGSPLYTDMTVLQFLYFIADAHKITGELLYKRIDWVIETLGLSLVLEKNIDNLSKGFKRRVGLAQALIHDPQVLILDEPTDGLDPIQKKEVRSLITNMAKDKAIIISTHILEEVEPVCNRAAIISKGKVLFDGNSDILLNHALSHDSVILKLNHNEPDNLSSKFKATPGVSNVSYKGEEVKNNYLFSITADKNIGIQKSIAEICFQQQVKVLELKTESPKLEAVFQEIINANRPNK